CPGPRGRARIPPAPRRCGPRSSTPRVRRPPGRSGTPSGTAPGRPRPSAPHRSRPRTAPPPGSASGCVRRARRGGPGRRRARSPAGRRSAREQTGRTPADRRRVAADRYHPDARSSPPHRRRGALPPPGGARAPRRFSRTAPRLETRVRPPLLLTSAGSDSDGAFGIQADLKTFTALGVYGASAVSMICAVNTTGVQGTHYLPGEVVRSQIDAVVQDLLVDA